MKLSVFAWFACILFLSACGSNTTVRTGPSVNLGPVTISAYINSNGEVSFGTTISIPLVGTTDLGASWNIGFDTTLNEAKDKQYTLFILYRDSNGDVIQDEYAINRPFEINFNNNQWVKRIEHDGNGNIVVYVEPNNGIISSTPISQKVTSIETPEAIGASNVETTDPIKFIRYYYQNINAKNYQTTWSLLSESFINTMHNSSQGGYQGYVNFWNTVNSVEIFDIAIESQTSDSAIIYVHMTYHYKNGANNSGYQHFNLFFDRQRNTWLFDK